MTKMGSRAANAPSRILLTDEQAAAEFPSWSINRIKRLRLSGKIPYYPGRPPLIDKADLTNYMRQLEEDREARRIARASKPPPPDPERRAWQRVVASFLRRRARGLDTSSIARAAEAILARMSKEETD